VFTTKHLAWIEVEAKHKEKAIAYLRSWWLLENNF